MSLRRSGGASCTPFRMRPSGPTSSSAGPSHHVARMDHPAVDHLVRERGVPGDLGSGQQLGEQRGAEHHRGGTTDPNGASLLPHALEPGTLRGRPRLSNIADWRSRGLRTEMRPSDARAVDRSGERKASGGWVWGASGRRGRALSFGAHVPGATVGPPPAAARGPGGLRPADCGDGRAPVERACEERHPAPRGLDHRVPLARVAWIGGGAGAGPVPGDDEAAGDGGCRRVFMAGEREGFASSLRVKPHPSRSVADGGVRARCDAFDQGRPNRRPATLRTHADTCGEGAEVRRLHRAGSAVAHAAAVRVPPSLLGPAPLESQLLPAWTSESAWVRQRAWLFTSRRTHGR